jgi:formylmethanofuran dehydrogenase subunit B
MVEDTKERGVCQLERRMEAGQAKTEDACRRGEERMKDEDSRQRFWTAAKKKLKA